MLFVQSIQVASDSGLQRHGARGAPRLCVSFTPTDQKMASALDRLGRLNSHVHRAYQQRVSPLQYTQRGCNLPWRARPRARPASWQVGSLLLCCKLSARRAELCGHARMYPVSLAHS